MHWMIFVFVDRFNKKRKDVFESNVNRFWMEEFIYVVLWEIWQGMFPLSRILLEENMCLSTIQVKN